MTTTTEPSATERQAIAARQSLAKQLQRIRVFRTNVLRRDGAVIADLAEQLETAVRARLTVAGLRVQDLRRERERDS